MPRLLSHQQNIVAVFALVSIIVRETPMATFTTDDKAATGDAPVAEPVAPTAEIVGVESTTENSGAGGWLSTVKKVGGVVGTGLMATGRAAVKVGAAGAAGTSKALTERKLRKLSREQQAILDAAAAAEKAKEEGVEVPEEEPRRRGSWMETLKEVASDVASVTVAAASSATAEFNIQVEEHEIVKKLEEIGLKKPDLTPETEKCHSGKCGICKSCQRKKAETAAALASLERVAAANGREPLPAVPAVVEEAGGNASLVGVDKGAVQEEGDAL
jgi:hypothetical protein